MYVGDVILQAVVLILLLSLLTDHPGPLAHAAVVNTGVEAVLEVRLGASTLTQTSPHL